MTLFFTMLVPGILAAVAITGTVKRVDVYQGLADGAVDGMKILVRILPALVGLLTVRLADAAAEHWLGDMRTASSTSSSAESSGTRPISLR